MHDAVSLPKPDHKEKLLQWRACERAVFMRGQGSAGIRRCEARVASRHALTVNPQREHQTVCSQAGPLSIE